MNWLATATALDQSEAWGSFITDLYDRFLVCRCHDAERTGQALMNALWEVRPNIHTAITGTPDDCFYEDARISLAIVAIHKRFTGEVPEWSPPAGIEQLPTKDDPF